eukprot:COSAG06_NODE_15875_length_1038_cov_1.277955_1_plen_160_part_10
MVDDSRGVQEPLNEVRKRNFWLRLFILTMIILPRQARDKRRKTPKKDRAFSSLQTMCGCNDIGATPGQMGAHGHEADGGCECEGLTMRGKSYLVFDTVDKANAQRRVLSEALNFPPTLAFSHRWLRKTVLPPPPPPTTPSLLQNLGFSIPTRLLPISASP